MNPYRQAFYSSQASWHGHSSVEVILRKHAIRAPYYRALTAGWLPADMGASMADLACGAGQYIYFLRQMGYSRISGTDIDAEQVKLAQQAGLPCVNTRIQDFLQQPGEPFDGISMLDILEHFTLEELFEVMTLVSGKLKKGGRLIFSVPNAESPYGFYVRHNDITHELSFTALSLAEMLRCHGLKILEIRDPFPTAIDIPRKIYRGMAIVFRKLEALRIRMLGMVPPQYWCPVIWVVAEKT